MVHEIQKRTDRCFCMQIGKSRSVAQHQTCPDLPEYVTMMVLNQSEYKQIIRQNEIGLRMRQDEAVF